MNATSLYVSTCRLVLQADSEDSSSWTDLFRLVPYLRQSLSCTVCGNLLIEPYTPTETNCQHHVCRSCKGGRKKLKPSCSWCKNYEKYVENVQLRILLQCYKKLCEYVTSTSIYRSLFVSATSNGGSGDGTSSLVDLIQEGAGFKDDFKSNAGLSKSAYSILPCVYTSTSTQTGVAPATIGQSEGNSCLQAVEPQAIRTVSNGSSLYSVLFKGTGNKITIKRKANDLEGDPGDGNGCNTDAVSTIANGATNNWDVFKKPAPRVTTVRGPGGAKRRGCRCGNATATPGKLTCCGQRCPCYVESKACVECRCRGCRNPHRPGGKKCHVTVQSPVFMQLYSLMNAAASNHILWLHSCQVFLQYCRRNIRLLLALLHDLVQTKWGIAP
ncbi:E3 ubiquitin-protein ligase MSL2 isoform X2 [Schistocerca gregaria]|uniref:E3 ubiquitin-protein ligase MSL2 isoform X2 n=1 Tax=Schistocerca gregaria TaxID=7010 RepID=UPI00211EF3D0|nr:E3 ubiquitin-protein ligase MSL2 isoform X2 [Schistocerca gregaria]